MELKQISDAICNISRDLYLEEFKTSLDNFTPLQENKIRFNYIIFVNKC